MRLMKRSTLLAVLIVAVVLVVTVVSVTVYFIMPVRIYCAANKGAGLSVNCSRSHLWEVYEYGDSGVLFCWVGVGPAPRGPFDWQYSGAAQQVQVKIACPTLLDLPLYLHASIIRILMLAVVGLTVGLVSLALFVKRKLRRLNPTSANV
jgi:hypothetical protein